MIRTLDAFVSDIANIRGNNKIFYFQLRFFGLTIAQANQSDALIIIIQFIYFCGRVGRGASVQAS